MELFALVVLAFGVFVCGLVVRAGVASIKEMETPDRMLSPLKPSASHPLLDDARQSTGAWAERHGFRPDVALDFTSEAGPQIAVTKVVTWRNDQRDQTLCLFVTPLAASAEFISQYTGGRRLSTSAVPGAMTLPHRPGNFVQCFPEMSLDQLYRAHASGERYLEQRFQAPRAPVPSDMQEAIVEEMTAGIRYVQSLALWQLRIPFWFFLRRRLLTGKAVSERG